jgi:hypothetical protein
MDGVGWNDNTGQFDVAVQSSVVPESSTLVLLGIGGIALIGYYSLRFVAS